MAIPSAGLRVLASVLVCLLLAGTGSGLSLAEEQFELLSGLKIGQLRKRAALAGASEAAIDTSLDTDDPKGSLIELIEIYGEMKSQEDEGDEGEGAGEDVEDKEDEEDEDDEEDEEDEEDDIPGFWGYLFGSASDEEAPAAPAPPVIRRLVVDQDGPASAHSIDSWVFDDILGGTVSEASFLQESWQRAPLYTNSSALAENCKECHDLRLQKLQRLLSLQAVEAMSHSPAYFDRFMATQRRFQQVREFSTFSLL